MNATALAEMPKSEVVGKLQRVLAAAKRMREHTKKGTRQAAHAVLGIAGGAASGALFFKMPTVPGTEIPSDVALGTLLVVGAAAGLADGYDDELCSFGAGLLAGAAARETTVLLQKREKKN